jgi:uncharacterized membrane protein YdfJ with MMPL/SSD domain
MGFVASYVRCVGKVWPLVILLWLGLLVFGVIRGPNLLLNTDNEVQETKGTLSEEANAIMNDSFDFSGYTPWIIVAECTENFPDSTGGCAGGDKTPVLDNVLHTLFDEVQSELKKNHEKVFNWEKTTSYFTFSGTAFDTLKKNFISENGQITYLQLAATREITQAVRFKAYHELKHILPELKEKYCPNCSFLSLTGGDPLQDDVTNGLAEMLLRTNAVIIPIAMAIMVYMVGSWRLLLITGFNVGVVVLGAFAISDFIADRWTRPQSITPQMIEVISIAITIDYSLFMFTRFIQELNVKRKRWNIRRHHYFLTVHSDTTSPNDRFVAPLQAPPRYGSDYFGLTFDKSLDSDLDPHPGLSNPGQQLLLSALVSTVEHSGHVVLVSGLTLLLSFAGFIMTRCAFLIQPAIFTAIGVALSILTALTTTVAFITGFPSFFTDFNPFPSWMYCCCRERRKTMMFDTDFTGDEIYIEDPDDLSYQAATDAATNYGSSAPNRFQSHQSFAYENKGFPGAVNDFEPRPSNARTGLLGSAVARPAAGYGADLEALEASPSQVIAFKGQTKDVSTVVNIEAFHKSLSYKVGKYLVKFPFNFLVLAIAFAGMGYLAHFAFKMELSSAYALGIPSNSPSLAALHKLESSFPPGIIQPFYFMMQWTPKDTTTPPDKLSKDMFLRGAEFVKTFSDATGIEPKYTYSPFWWEGKYIDDPDNTPFDGGYLAQFTQTVNATDTNVTYLMTLLSPISPDSPSIVDLIKTMRTNVTHVLNEKYQDDEKPTKFYLAGYKATEQDTIDAAQATFPLMLSVTFAVVIAVVSVLLKSVFVPIRLILTLALPLASTLGLQVLVFQYGILEWTGIEAFNPGHEDLKCIYWELLPFIATVLLSLALDYDVFIISRIAEHRENGFTNQSSILMGLFETSGVINAAGIIMALTFSGLMFLKGIATSQLGFCLVISVLLDCFVTRTILVPAILSWADGIGWWPRRVQFTGLKHYDGTLVN